MKKLSLLFAFIGFFSLSNASAQSACCAIFTNGTCILCPSPKAVSSTETAACKPVDPAACAKATTACKTAAAACQSEKAVAVGQQPTAQKAESNCKAMPAASCSPAKATKTSSQLAQKSN